MVQGKHGWEFRRPPGTEPIRTFFGRTEKGGLITGMEMPFDTSIMEGDRLVLSYSPSLNVKAGERLACEPMYLGCIGRNGRDLRRSVATGCRGPARHDATPVRVGRDGDDDCGHPWTATAWLSRLACGWHCQMQQDATTRTRTSRRNPKIIRVLWPAPAILVALSH